MFREFALRNGTRRGAARSGHRTTLLTDTLIMTFPVGHGDLVNTRVLHAWLEPRTL